MIIRSLIAVGALSTLCACAVGSVLGLPKTPGEQAASYGYVPLDPLAVDQLSDADSCKELADNGEAMPLLDALPDLAIRFAVADVDASGGLTFGPSKLTSEGGTYRAVLDYVNVDAVPVIFLVHKRVVKSSGDVGRWEGPSYKLNKISMEYVERYEAHIRGKSDVAFANDEKFEVVTMPVYIGVGLRLSADIRAIKGNISLSGLGAIGAQAEASALSGTLTVQTLGVNGASLATALPLPNKLDQTTIESGILAIGTSRAMLYTAGLSGAAGEKIVATPRVVGLYSPIGSDPALINAVYAEISRVRPAWTRPCRPKASTASQSQASTPRPTNPPSSSFKIN